MGSTIEFDLEAFAQIGGQSAQDMRIASTPRFMPDRKDVFVSQRIEPADGVERALLLDTWSNFFAEDMPFTRAHFAIFAGNMIRLIGGRVEGPYREARLVSMPSSGHDTTEINIQWSPSHNSGHTIPGGNASIEMLGNSDEGYSIAERFEYGEDVRSGDKFYPTPIKIREAVLPGKMRSPMTGLYIETHNVRSQIGSLDPRSFRLEGRAIAEKIFTLVSQTTAKTPQS